MAELILYYGLKRHLPRVHWVRLENVVTSGLPDLEGAYSDQSAWLELKERPRVTAPVYVRPSQRNWWLERTRVSRHLWLLVYTTAGQGVTLHPCREALPRLRPAGGSLKTSWQLAPEDLRATTRHRFGYKDPEGWGALCEIVFTSRPS